MGVLILGLYSEFDPWPFLCANQSVIPKFSVNNVCPLVHILCTDTVLA